ncbi:uncharacterized protein TM35_000351680 [Trypanosoma theileri]|uniref:Uncharacterized protein n=1 Tax=Trypanosoma theileri TaxID=67003 RepID=A0A1X0NKW6_9TRYP|nr:uncharacterized protein TM35_000351680 [Trypanosoma theileri]ORC85424.1 hypothetical protein TM35_000351680 [Trypanosoma theileri]
MGPSEIDPLTSLHGPGATPRDVVRSSSTFFLWEQMYGVAKVSPIPSRILLYHMQHEQNQKKMDRPIIEQHKNRLWTNSSSEESRKNDFLAETSLTTEPTRVYISSEGCQPFSRHTERSPQAHKKHNAGRSDSFIFENVYRKLKHTPESKKDVSCTDEINPTKNSCNDNYTLQVNSTVFSPPPPPPLDFSVPSSAFPSAEVNRSPRDGDELFSGSSYRILAEDLTFVFSSERDKWMDTRNQLNEEVEDTADENGICSEPSVVLNPGANDEGRGFAFVHHNGSGSSSGSKTHYPVPDPTRLTGAPVSQQLHWDISVEAQRLTDNEEVCSDIVGVESVGMDKRPENLRGRGSEHEGENLTKEDFSVFSDSRRDYFPANESPSSEFPKGSSFSVSPLRPRQMFCSETPPRRSIDESEEKVLPPPQSSTAEEAPKGRVRRYNPPSFSCTGPREVVGELSGMYGQLHSAGVKKDTMSSGMLGSQTTGFVLKNTSDISLHQHGLHPSSVSNSHPPAPPQPPPEAADPISEELLISPRPSKPSRLSQLSQSSQVQPPPEPAKLLLEEALFSPQGSVSISKSPEADIDNELQLSKKSTPTIKEDDSSVIRKSVSTSLGAVNANQPNCPEQQKEPKSMVETGEAVLSVSPSPSYKNYEWATKAQEELEQQRKRRVARTPSANSLSPPPLPPPPLKVSDFEQPQPPKGRSAVQKSLIKGRGENTKVTGATATEEKQQESHVLLENILTSENESSTRETKRSCIQSITPVKNTVEGKRGRTMAAEATSAAKRTRRGTVSPSTVVEFPLPRDVGVNGTGKEKRGKGGNRKGRK